MRIFPMGIGVIPIPIYGFSHSFPFAFPIWSFIPISNPIPMVISTDGHKHHCLGQITSITIAALQCTSRECQAT